MYSSFHSSVSFYSSEGSTAFSHLVLGKCLPFIGSTSDTSEEKNEKEKPIEHPRMCFCNMAASLPVMSNLVEALFCPGDSGRCDLFLFDCRNSSCLVAALLWFLVRVEQSPGALHHTNKTTVLENSSSESGALHLSRVTNFYLRLALESPRGPTCQNPTVSIIFSKRSFQRHKDEEKQ